MKHLSRAALACLCALLIGLAAREARADYLFQSYLVPSGPTDYSAWDVFYTPYDYPNYPDISAPFGTYRLASAAGVTPPPNSSPANPGAYWDPGNPVITQVGTPSAFIIGASTEGNIYSFSAPTAFQLADTTSYSDGLVLLQLQTEGTTADFSSITLSYTNASNQVVTISPAQYVTEYEAASVSGQGFSVTNRMALEWNLSGLGVSSFTINFAASAPSMSLQQATLDTASSYFSTVPQYRTWNLSGTGAWSAGANWSQGSPSVANGNVLFAQSGSAGVTLDSSRVVGNIAFDTPGSVAITASPGATLTVNTGITTGSTSTGNYAINAGYILGAYNLFDIASGTVQLNGEVSGTYGFFKQGDGALVLSGSNSFGGGVGMEGGTLVMSGANNYNGGTSVLWGQLIVAGDALNNTPGALGNDNSTIPLGADATLYAYQQVGPSAAITIDGNHTLARNILMADGAMQKILSAQDAPGGATFSGAINIGASTDVRLIATAATDRLAFTGGITGGANGAAVTINGQGAVTFSGTRPYDYTASTNILSGNFIVDKNAALTATGSVSVSPGASLEVDGTLAGSGTLALSGTLRGAGAVNRPFSIGPGATIAPGDNGGTNTGTLATAAETWLPGGTFLWVVNDAIGAAGAADGWSLLSVTGLLALDLTAGTPFHIALQSDTPSGQPGAPAGFNPAQNYTWEIAAASGGITGFDPADIVVDATGFSGAPAGNFSVTASGDDLYVNYTAVPEPSAPALLAIGCFTTVIIRRRIARRRACLQR